MMDVKKIREDFPILANNKKLIYFDNASTSLKPKQVIEAEARYYEEIGGNTGRGSHRSSQKASQEFDSARKEVAGLINAKSSELAFMKNTTEGINTIAVSMERSKMISEGDEIIVSFLEHHANLIPWQELCKRTGAKLKVVSLNKDYTVNLQDLEGKISKKTKLVAMTHASNTVASILPAKEVAKISHDNNALFLLDGAQSVPDFEVDIKKIGADFTAFSAHKMLGPTGIGALYIKEEHIRKMQPYGYGGGIIKKVTIEKSEYLDSIEKFEPGTMQIAQALGFAEAARYLKKIGLENVHEHTKGLLKHSLERAEKIEGLVVYGPKNPEKQRSIMLFEIKGIDPVDLAIAVDEAANVAIRSGLHCAEPIVSSINPKGLDRASYYIYNTKEEIDVFIESLSQISRMFR